MTNDTLERRPAAGAATPSLHGQPSRPGPHDKRASADGHPNRSADGESALDEQNPGEHNLDEDQDRPSPDNHGPNGRTFVTLSVGDQICGIPVLLVRDILGEQAITRIPLAPREIAGSLNLRGRIVTAIDLRRRLQLPPAPPGLARISIVVEQGGELYALLVDQVSEVMALAADQFEAAVTTLPPTWARYCNGIYRLPGRLMVVLDVARLLDFAVTAT